MGRNRRARGSTTQNRYWHHAIIETLDSFFVFIIDHNFRISTGLSNETELSLSKQPCGRHTCSCYHPRCGVSLRIGARSLNTNVRHKSYIRPHSINTCTESQVAASGHIYLHVMMHTPMLWPHDFKCSPYGRMKSKRQAFGEQIVNGR